MQVPTRTEAKFEKEKTRNKRRGLTYFMTYILYFQKGYSYRSMTYTFKIPTRGRRTVVYYCTLYIQSVYRSIPQSRLLDKKVVFLIFTNIIILSSGRFHFFARVLVQMEWLTWQMLRYIVRLQICWSCPRVEIKIGHTPRSNMNLNIRLNNIRNIIFRTNIISLLVAADYIVLQWKRITFYV